MNKASGGICSAQFDAGAFCKYFFPSAKLKKLHVEDDVVYNGCVKFPWIAALETEPRLFWPQVPRPKMNMLHIHSMLLKQYAVLLVSLTNQGKANLVHLFHTGLARSVVML